MAGAALAALAAGIVPSAPAASEAGVVSAGHRAVADELLVGYRPGASAAERRDARARADARLAERVVPGDAGTAEVELVRLPPGSDRSAAERRIEEHPSVVYAEDNIVYTHTATSSDPSYTNGSLWGMYGDATTPANGFGSQAGEAWAAGNTGAGTVYVGVIDEGIQVDHPDLDANVWVNPHDPVDGVDNDANGYVDDTNGWDFANGDRTVYDGGTLATVDSHGTHVAGTIGAESNSAGVVGVAWNVKLISAKFLGATGGTTSNAVKAVDYLTNLKVRHGLNIVATNNSWGGGGFSQSLYDAIERSNRQNILFVAAAGNGGADRIGDNNDATPQYPASYANANVVAVAALNSDGTRASYSNYGSTSVDLGAPGSSITSTLPYNTYGTYSGTSMATPHVTGGAVLYAATHPGAPVAEVKKALLDTAVATASLSGKTVTGGRLDVSGLHAYTPPATTEPPASPTTSVTAVTYSTANKNRDLLVTLTVKDSSGAAVANADVSVAIDHKKTAADAYGAYRTGTGTTGTNGTVTFRINRAPAGWYTTRVTAVAPGSLNWDGATPANEFQKN